MPNLSLSPSLPPKKDCPRFLFLIPRVSISKLQLQLNAPPSHLSPSESPSTASPSPEAPTTTPVAPPPPPSHPPPHPSPTTTPSLPLFPRLVLRLRLIVDQQRVQRQRVRQDEIPHRAAADVDGVERDGVGLDCALRGARFGGHLDGAEGGVHLWGDGCYCAVDYGAVFELEGDGFVGALH